MPSLSIHVLNVGHGDSIIIHYSNEAHGENSYALIDSNRGSASDEVPPAYEFLKSRGVEHLEFVLLTHPHADHYGGMASIIRDFSIGIFYSYPLGWESLNNSQKEKFKSLHEKFARSKSGAIRKGTLELFEVIHELTVKNIEVQEINGPHQPIYPDGFDDSIEFECLMPLRLHRGKYLEMIESGNDSLVGCKDWNKISIALSIKFKNKRILLCGDTHYLPDGWLKQRQLTRNSLVLDSSCIKISHHGSKADNHVDALSYLYSVNSSDHGKEKLAIISAPGNQNHPASECLKNLDALGIKPYCTNLSKFCAADIVLLKQPDPNLTRDMSIFIEQNKFLMRPCQGNIEYQISDIGSQSVNTEYAMFCPYRD